MIAALFFLAVTLQKTDIAPVLCAGRGDAFERKGGGILGEWSDPHGGVVALPDGVGDLAGPLAVANHAELARGDLQRVGHIGQGQHSRGEDDGVGLHGDRLPIPVRADDVAGPPGTCPGAYP